MPAKKAASKAPRAKKAATPAPAAEPATANRERIVFPKALYDERKDEVKAPIKEHALKWQFLGEGKGRYAKEGVNVFVMFTDEGVDYTVWGSDEATVEALLSAWRKVLGAQGFAAATQAGEQAAQAEAAKAESDAMRLWRLQEPQRRPGEPDFFFNKRVSEWQAKKPE